METEEVGVPLTLPDTQNADSQCFTQSQTIDEAEKSMPVWGRLCPNDSNFPLVELIKDEFTFGRLSDCDICVKDMLPKKKEQTISKVHFRIHREKCFTSTGLEDNVVYLTDESQNGTFVNDKLVGKKKTIVLVNNDLIAVARTTCKVYVFMSTSGYDDSFLPEDLRCKYVVSRTLGTGACGEVKLCFSKSGLIVGKKYAMKMISKVTLNTIGHKKNSSQEKFIMNEIEICKRLKHPCIIKVEEFYDSPSMVYIILELMEGGELFERIRRNNGLSEKNAKFIFYQIVLAVNYLHDNDVTHRDLKPENILLASQDEYTVVKVSDFGLSKLVDSQTMMKTFCGTPMYVAPEILITGGRGAYSNKVDVWSLGVILYCCLSGATPFRMNNKNITLYDQIRKGLYDFNLSKFFTVSHSAKDLIRRMMTVDPVKRISIKSVLKHPWLRDEEMLMKVNNVLGISNCENVSPDHSNDNISNEFVQYKRPRLD